MKNVIELNLQLDTSKVIGKSSEEISRFIQNVVAPTILEGLTQHSRSGEAGCSVHDNDGHVGGECHVSIHF